MGDVGSRPDDCMFRVLSALGSSAAIGALLGAITATWTVRAPHLRVPPIAAADASGRVCTGCAQRAEGQGGACAPGHRARHGRLRRHVRGHRRRLRGCGRACPCPGAGAQNNPRHVCPLTRRGCLLARRRPQCVSESLRGKKDVWNGALGGAAAGSVVGLRGAPTTRTERACRTAGSACGLTPLFSCAAASVPMAFGAAAALAATSMLVDTTGHTLRGAWARACAQPPASLLLPCASVPLTLWAAQVRAALTTEQPPRGGITPVRCPPAVFIRAAFDCCASSDPAAGSASADGVQAASKAE